MHTRTQCFHKHHLCYVFVLKWQQWRDSEQQLRDGVSPNHRHPKRTLQNHGMKQLFLFHIQYNQTLETCAEKHSNLYLQQRHDMFVFNLGMNNKLLPISVLADKWYF